jgi:hypothetical protein
MQAFVDFAKEIGMSDQAGDLLLKRKIQAPTIEITAMVLDAIKQSGSFPAIADLLKPDTAMNETQFLILLDVYSNLAIEYFAKYLSYYTPGGTISIDVDMGELELDGKRVVEVGDEHEFVLGLFKSAKIRHKTFAKGTSVETIIRYTNHLRQASGLFSQEAKKLLFSNSDLRDAFEQNHNPSKHSLSDPQRRYSLIESSL